MRLAAKCLPARLGEAMKRGLPFVAFLVAAILLVGQSAWATAPTVDSIMTAADPAADIGAVATALGTFVGLVVTVYAGFKTVKIAMRWFGWVRG